MSGRSCRVATNRRLERAGIKGEFPELRVEGDRLVMTGSEGTALAVPAREVRWLRFGRFEPSARTHGFCEARVAWSGPSLYLATHLRDADFAAIMSGFARQVAAARGLGALRRGPDLATAIVMFLLTVGSLTVLLALLLAAAFFDGGWWWAPAILFLPLWLLALRSQLRQHWPRRLGDLAALDSLLPARKETRP